MKFVFFSIILLKFYHFFVYHFWSFILNFILILIFFKFWPSILSLFFFRKVFIAITFSVTFLFLLVKDFNVDCCKYHYIIIAKDFTKAKSSSQLILPFKYLLSYWTELWFSALIRYLILLLISLYFLIHLFLFIKRN